MNEQSGQTVRENEQLKQTITQLVIALDGLLQSAKNWACCCEINGEGLNNAASIHVRHAEEVLKQMHRKWGTSPIDPRHTKIGCDALEHTRMTKIRGRIYDVGIDTGKGESTSPTT